MAQASVGLQAAGSAGGLNSAFWIDFEDARRLVETIVDVAHDDPDERPTCIVLVGQSGMGKTSILREAQRRISADFPDPHDQNEARYTPMLRSVIPSSPTSLKINLTLLKKQGWPITNRIMRIADLKVVELLREQHTRMVAIDNVHAMLTASGRARRDTLDAFRFLMSEGNVPMVVAGLDVAEFLWPNSMGVTGNFKRLLHWGYKSARRRGRARVELADLHEAAQLLPAYTAG
jgi:hypothetical protein